MVPQTGGHAQFFSRDKSSVKKIGNENTIINTSDRRSRPIFSEIKQSDQIGTGNLIIGTSDRRSRPIFPEIKQSDKIGTGNIIIGTSDRRSRPIFFKR